MNRSVRLALTPADPNTFSGTAFITLMASAEQETPLKLYYVRFEPGASTNWHRHDGVQILVVTAGRCRYQREGEEVREINAGESVRFESGIRHWHGAATSEAAEHIAVNLEIRKTEWLEPVADG